jgi:hypothetical protein
MELHMKRTVLAVVVAMSLSAVAMAGEAVKTSATAEAKSPSVTATRPANLDWELRNR